MQLKYHHFITLNILLLLVLIPWFSYAQAPLKKIDRSALEFYLSKSINVQGLNDFCKTSDGFYPGTNERIVHDAELMANAPVGTADYITQQDRKSGQLFERYHDMLRLIENVKAKFITDAVTQWGAWDWDIHLNRCRNTVRDIKQIDEEIIVQASVNEFVDVATTGGVGNIPAWVFEAFGIPFQSRNFNIHQMMFADWQVNPKHYWSHSELINGLPTALVPDISRQESKMWLYYQGRIFIDMGCESLSFSQVELMNNGSYDPAQWNEVFQLLRDYADSKNNIRFLLITGHTNGMKDLNEQLLFDFHSSPVRPSELNQNLSENGGSCHITPNSCNWGDNTGKIYNLSMGGISPSGWSCTNLPGVVFIDNYGNNEDISLWGLSTGTEECNQYHFDEISWYALQDKEYRDNWLRYAYYIVHHIDPVIYFSLPVKRRVTYRKVWSPTDYLANNPIATILPPPHTLGNVYNGLVDRNNVQIYAGYGQETTIKEILSTDTLTPIEIKLYPNPAIGEITIYISTKLGLSKLHYTLTDLMGKKILSAYLSNDKKNNISAKGLSKGMYILTIYDEYNQVLSGNKVVIQE